MNFKYRNYYDLYKFYFYVLKEGRKIEITSYHNGFVYLNRESENNLPVNYGAESWGFYNIFLPQEKDYII